MMFIKPNSILVSCNSNTQLIFACFATFKWLSKFSGITREKVFLVKFFHWDRLSHLHDPICRIVARRIWVSPFSKIGRNSICRSLVHNPSFIQQNQTVKAVEDL